MTIYLNHVVELGLAVAGCGAVAAVIPLARDEMRLRKLNAGPSYVFRNMAEFEQRGLGGRFCREAFAAARARKQRDCFGYEAWEQEKCIARHGSHYDTVTVPMVCAEGLGQSETVRYMPRIGGYQVLHWDPRSAEPLYMTTDPDVLMRRDGKIFSVSQPA